MPQGNTFHRPSAQVGPDLDRRCQPNAQRIQPEPCTQLIATRRSLGSGHVRPLLYCPFSNPPPPEVLPCATPQVVGSRTWEGDVARVMGAAWAQGRLGMPGGSQRCLSCAGIRSGTRQGPRQPVTRSEQVVQRVGEHLYGEDANKHLLGEHQRVIDRVQSAYDPQLVEVVVPERGGG